MSRSEIAERLDQHRDELVHVDAPGHRAATEPEPRRRGIVVDAPSFVGGPVAGRERGAGQRAFLAAR